MDQTQLKQKIAEYFGKLPKESQDVFSSMVWMDVLKNIGVKYNLNANQIETLGTETTLAMLGIIHLEEYINNLQKELGLKEEIFDGIVTEIDENIFKNIKGQLVETFEANANSLLEEDKTPETKPINLPVLDSRFSGLSKQVQEAIARSNWRETLYSLAPKYKLNIEQMGILEEITTKVILGTVPSVKYGEELSLKINISKEDIANLIKEVDENIFKKIREEEEVITNYRLPITDENKKITDYQLPITNKKKIITDYQLPIKNETLEEGVPLPPYRTSGKEYVVSSKEEEIFNTNTSQNNVQDILKKIEPVKPVGPTSQVIKLQAQQPEQNQTATPQQSTPSVRSIIEEKLKVNTVSEDVVSDYSAPKKNDPYREAV